MMMSVVFETKGARERSSFVLERRDEKTSLSFALIHQRKSREREREREREPKGPTNPKMMPKNVKKKRRHERKKERHERKKKSISMKKPHNKKLSRDRRATPKREKKKSIMRDDSDPEDADEDDADEDAFDADVLEEAPSTSALEEEEDDDATIINAGLHNVSNTCYLNATVQVMCICVFFLSSNFDIDSRDVFGPNAMFASVALLLAFVRLRSSSDHRTTTTNVL